MTEPGSAARRAVTGEAASAMRSAILDEIRDASFDRMADAGGTLALVSRAASTVASALSIYGEINNIYEMGVAGYRAFTIPRRRVERVAAAHAFGYWVFQYPGMRAPTGSPPGFQREMQDSDAEDREVARRIGNPNYSSDGGLSAAEWRNIWSSSARSTISGLESELQDKASRGQLTPGLREAMGGHEQHLASQPATDIATQYRLMVIGGGFRRNPAIAARAFLLGSLKEEDSHHARDAILRFYARYPYSPSQQ